MKILLGATGSVAAIRVPDLIDSFIVDGHDVQVIMTERATKFCKMWKIPSLVRIWLDKDEWINEYKVHESPVLHIELREWADLFLVAPLSANTLAKLANGLADNLLTCVARAWDLNKPIVVAPAMNTQMWEHPATEEHLLRLDLWIPKLTIIEPIKKMLACGTEGIGAMAEVGDIVSMVEQALRQSSSPRGSRLSRAGQGGL